MSKKQSKQQVQKVNANSKELTNQESLEKNINFFKESALLNKGYGHSPEELAEKGGRKLQESRNNWKGLSKEEKKYAKSEIHTILATYSKAISLETNINMLNGIDPEQRGMAMDMIEHLKKEYALEKPQDKVYLQIAVSAICRYHSNMSEFECWKRHDWNSHERATYMGMLSKDADKAFRQYNSIIQYFEEKKQPQIKINVKANNAFVAQNQQFNNNKNESNTK